MTEAFINCIARQVRGYAELCIKHKVEPAAMAIRVYPSWNPFECVVRLDMRLKDGRACFIGSAVENTVSVFCVPEKFRNEHHRH